MADIKILVACHQENVYVPDNPLIYPIQVGAANASKHFEGMLHDDEGENISTKNPMYCELTALYWAWKNLEADYIGLFHYRRYFSFSSERFKTDLFADIILDSNDDATYQMLGYDEENMRSIIESADVIVPEKGYFTVKINMREQYGMAREQVREDLECVIDILQEKYPHMMDAANKYLDSFEGYFCNMSIMRKDLFDDYCAWMFDILEEHERRRDVSDYDPVSMRVSGYLGERLSAIYFTWLEQEGYRLREAQRVLFQDVQKDPLPKPAFPDENAVALVLAANDYYAPYVSALLESIVDHSSDDRKYDVIILNTDISKRNQERLARQLDRPNFNLRFFNAKFYMRHRKGLFLRGHFRIETYYRLLMQDILPDYPKALYLDSDMIVMRDIAELFDVDLDGYLMAACHDADTAGLYNGFELQKKQYMDEVLRVSPYEYFQAGTIVFNLDEFRRTYTVDELFKYAASYEWELLDQDVLNHFGQGRTKYVDMSWNVMFDWAGIRVKEIIGIAPKSLYDEHMEARKHPYIIHYAGPAKPWEVPDCDFAEQFWDYSRRTPFYEEALRRLCNPAAKPASQRAKDAIRATSDKLLPRNSQRRQIVRKMYRKVDGIKRDLTEGK